MSSKHHASALFLCTVLIGLLLPLQAGADDGRRGSLSASLGLTAIDPGLSSNAVRFFPDSGGEITFDDTIEDRGPSTRPSLTLSWHLPFADGNLALETVLGPPFSFSFQARGGALETEVSGKLGETDMLPPVLVLSYNFPLNLPVQPYLGAGVTYLYSFNSEITTGALGSAKLEIENVSTWLVQAGIDIELDWPDWHETLFFRLDVKYIDPVHARADISSIEAGGTTGDSVTRLKLEPWALNMGLGWRF